MTPATYSMNVVKDRPNDQRLPLRRGVTTVEMAIIASTLFLFIFGGFEVTRLISLKQTAEYASYAGARAGIISGATAEQAEAMALAHLQAVGIRDADIIVEPAVIDEESDIVKVRVEIPMASNSWGVPQFFSGTMAGQSSLLTERAATVMNETVQNLPVTPPPGTPTDPPPGDDPGPGSQPPTQPGTPGDPGTPPGDGDGPTVPPQPDGDGPSDPPSDPPPPRPPRPPRPPQPPQPPQPPAPEPEPPPGPVRLGV